MIGFKWKKIADGFSCSILSGASNREQGEKEIKNQIKPILEKMGVENLITVSGKEPKKFEKTMLVTCSISFNKAVALIEGRVPFP